ncbi:MULTISPECIES: class I SAM-dependent methyltransferase [unclassified Campylobacter]|uniref:class I SAM-dependent methyltransferase n=1 Tax=unclassified Campylobacter TaxID=2593542 RepID=UPI001237C557|nr:MULTISPECIES: class I SAM-dependent methyltransferase [unclassified Campylobacter]KAA6225438.1 class I SAM-dependent methyltransferase [Campylobacter sp. LR196d]KAA6228790.1 class I SAM-dependent methyltransferase [Campylobacter sp. LR185c]KAA6229926.1 class I SAM-dependent methyltransferase [Campylobacter sp. LR286c]KAA8604157.1 hypothetical protein CGP82_04380 [Campylobacter sp. LR185c]
MNQDRAYWSKFYKVHKEPFSHSLFADFVLKFLGKNEKILELGCGNGRDSVFFAKKGFEVWGVDLCESEISFLQNHYANDKLTFLCANFCELNFVNEFSLIYSRFTLHSINKDDENKLFSWLNKGLKKGGKFCVEVRGKKNSLFEKGEKVSEDSFIYENHYRRFLDFNELKIKLKNLGFELLFSEENKGFAPFKNEDDFFIRIIAIKS